MLKYAIYLLYEQQPAFYIDLLYLSQQETSVLKFWINVMLCSYKDIIDFEVTYNLVYLHRVYCSEVIIPLVIYLVASSMNYLCYLTYAVFIFFLTLKVLFLREQRTSSHLI